MASRFLPYGHGLRDTVYGDYYDESGDYSGGYYYDRPWWADLASQGIDAFGNRVNRGRQPQYPYQQQYPQQFNPGGLNTQGVQINWWVVGGVLAAILIFQSGRRR